MKLFTKVIQFLLPLYTIMGAVFMMENYKILATPQALSTLPSYFWTGLGVIQIMLAVTLISALFFKRARVQVFNSAVSLAGLSFLGIILFIAYQGFPGMLWAIVPAVLFAFIAHQSKH